MNLPGYDAWKLAGPPDITPEQERQMENDAREDEDNLRQWIADVLADHRADIYLATIRRIVVEELNKLERRAAEPAWQTAERVRLPPYEKDA